MNRSLLLVPLSYPLKDHGEQTVRRALELADSLWNAHLYFLHVNSAHKGRAVKKLGVAIQDITERIKHERRLKESNERLEQFAYAASHDLQEPLRMVSSYLQMIEQRYADELDADGQEYIDFAVDGADRMCEMVDGLLEYSRVEAQGEPFEPVDLNTISFTLPASDL